jgi:hypothetical protein
MTNTYELLAEPFPPEVERTLTKSGTRLTYIPISEVIARLNRVLGVANWSSETVDVHRDHLDPDWVVAHVRVTAVVDGRPRRCRRPAGQAHQAGRHRRLGRRVQGSRLRRLQEGLPDARRRPLPRPH